MVAPTEVEDTLQSEYLRKLLPYKNDRQETSAGVKVLAHGKHITYYKN